MKRLFAVAFLALLLPLPVYADTARDALASARANADALSSYHLRLDDEGDPTDIDYAAPQRLRITKPGSTGIIIGGTAYLNVNGAGWTPSSVNATIAVLMMMLAQDSLITFTDEDDVVDQGPEALNGVAMHKYEIRTPVNGSFLRRTVWVGEKDGLPHRVERSGGITALTATYSQFNQDFNIEVPPGMQSPAQP